MAKTNLIFSFALTGFIILSIAHMAFGVARVNQVLQGPAGLASVEKSDSVIADVPNGHVGVSGGYGVSVADRVVNVDRSVSQEVDLENGKVTTGGGTAVNVVNGVAKVKQGGGETELNVVNGVSMNVKQTGFPANKDLPGAKITGGV
ncbi:hypothetical protein MKW94_020155 [Papaver nudicaule]|uniref:Uncharacterized protein n=1 Tax=Papaver nudicaule TaxID=74823 RepID=A0AA41VJZ8_PAPNU|nr:hypothetical protein [Papaver nudicaule]